MLPARAFVLPGVIGWIANLVCAIFYSVIGRFIVLLSMIATNQSWSDFWFFWSDPGCLNN